MRLRALCLALVAMVVAGCELPAIGQDPGDSADPGSGAPVEATPSASPSDSPAASPEPSGAESSTPTPSPTVSEPVPDETAVALKYPRPDFSGYQVIRLEEHPDQEIFAFGPETDVLLLGPRTPRKKHVWIQGGRHVAVVGGVFAPDYPGRGPTGTIQTKQQTGSLWLEGIRIDNAKSFGSDALTLNAAGTKAIPVTIQNVRIENVRGRQDDHLHPNDRPHGDVIQPQGRISQLRVFNLFGSTDYQGLFLMRQEAIAYGGKAASIDLERVQLHHNDSANKHCLYLLSIGGGTQEIRLRDVYLTKQPNKSGCAGESVLVGKGADIQGKVLYAEPATDIAAASDIAAVSAAAVSAAAE